jgi:hypothetical protein
MAEAGRSGAPSRQVRAECQVASDPRHGTKIDDQRFRVTGYIGRIPATVPYRRQATRCAALPIFFEHGLRYHFSG